VGHSRRRWILPAAVTVLVIAAALAALLYYAGRVSTDDAQVQAHITPVSAKISGYVSKLAIDDNSNVKEGDPLIYVDPRDYAAAEHQAQAAYDLAKAETERDRLTVSLTRNTTSQDTSGASAQKQADTADLASYEAQQERAATASLLQAKADVEAKHATDERAQSDLARYKPLLTTGDVSKFQYDSVDAIARVAKSELVAAQQELAAAQQAVDIARANTNAARAKVIRSQAVLQGTKYREQQVPIAVATYKAAVANMEKAGAALEEARLEFSYCTIVAPITGQVTQRSVTVGQYVSPGQLLLTLVPLDKVYVTANFKETQLDHVHPGQQARIHVDTYDRNFEGTVDSIAAASGSEQALLPPQNATGNFIKVVARIPVKILVKPTDNSRLILRPGMNVEASIYTR
jgi:membrane fusion protein (multidrug efflux system)